MSKIKISAVSYINTIPFIYGIENSDIRDKIDLTIDHPAACADRLINNKVDIGLVPVASLIDLNYYNFVSDYCIGATAKVKTVILASNSPLKDITTIFLDSQSRSSVMLAKVLAKNYWKINPKWENVNYNKLININDKNTAAVIIGDKVFDNEDSFIYKYDLAEEWIKYTKLPFVFATWVANKKIDNNFISEFNSALKYGVSNIDMAVANYDNSFISKDLTQEYLSNNISFLFDNRKKQGLELFLKYIK